MINEEDGEMQFYTISQLAREAEVKIATVRYYERRGLLREPPRTPSGHRQYSGDDLRRIRFIKSTQALGFSLAEIADLLSMRVAGDGTCRDIRQRIEDKLADIEGKIAALQEIKRALQNLERSCPGAGPLNDCPILAALDK
jgi:MerR family mercuric resistance operon transcriptional regulator